MFNKKEMREETKIQDLRKNQIYNHHFSTHGELEMDQLDITALSVSTKIGVHEWEQCIEQRLLIDISIPRDLSTCEDQLSNTIDYDQLCQTVTSYVESNQFALIETVANNVAALIKEQFAVKQLTVKVAKPHAILNAGNISITVVR